MQSAQRPSAVCSWAANGSQQALTACARLTACTTAYRKPLECPALFWQHGMSGPCSSDRHRLWAAACAAESERRTSEAAGLPPSRRPREAGDPPKSARGEVPSARDAAHGRPSSPPSPSESALASQPRFLRARAAPLGPGPCQRAGRRAWDPSSPLITSSEFPSARSPSRIIQH